MASVIKSFDVIGGDGDSVHLSRVVPTTWVPSLLNIWIVSFFPQSSSLRIKSVVPAGITPTIIVLYIPVFGGLFIFIVCPALVISLRIGTFPYPFACVEVLLPCTAVFELVLRDYLKIKFR